ncbi:MAG: hypothetical protein NTZ50_07700 [Chloroflexi bacterium]|nr:hypothetical protein [Chloroflexota bacterium]
MLLSRAYSRSKHHTQRMLSVSPQRSSPARNLLHDLALHRVDVRNLQMELAALDHSPLGRKKAYALNGV